MLELLCNSSKSNHHDLENVNNNLDQDDTKPKSCLFSNRYNSLAERVKDYVSQHNSDVFFSVEFFPPRTIKGARTLIRLVERFVDGEPFFCDITWQVAGQPASNLPTSSISTADVVLNYCCIDTMLHLICIGTSQVALRQHLEKAKKCGIRNILALRGDKHEKYESHDFSYACDLVSFIRKEYGKYFTIVVAGYPIPHPESKNRQQDRLLLKHKVDAQADFIITQMFFKCEDFLEFVDECRQIGIKVPIIPGICAINSYESLNKITKLSGIELPEELRKKLEPIKTNVEAIKEFGVYFLTDLCRKLLKSNSFPGIHFYSLNQDTIIRVIKNLGLWKKNEILELRLPWRRARNYQRHYESIRPVFWVQRPNTYVFRTKHWNKFPETVWFQDEYSSENFQKSLEDYPKFLEIAINEETRKLLLQCKNQENFYKLFYEYYSTYLFDDVDNDNNNNNSKKLMMMMKRSIVLPWFQRPNKNSLAEMFYQYGKFISNGMLATNYLPQMNGHNSSDIQIGWGEPDGYLYQKEYLEFFMDPQHLPKLKSLLIDWPKNRISYYISDFYGKEKFSNWPQQVPIYISWGMFPSHQLLSALIADYNTFDIWRQESYGLFDDLIDSIKSPDSGAGCDENDDPEDAINKSVFKTLDYVQKNFILVILIGNRFAQSTKNNVNNFENILKQIFL